ncbi:ATP-binding protein [Sulfurovum sp. TSL6]|uniref:ATP-binding protein n=1 Tax=Sulfurovum sp. TSL6 TaxID=2826995 RepID=UPI001CC58AE3|nr:ATP-binding protein [Sulfurovum sp. TSL6]GIT99723.1 ATP-binding protein [Sulfurovum sp. TSL6]
MVSELVKVTLINSADYGFGEFDFRGNTLLTGTNGAGKTTLIRAGLFFYYPKLDKKDLGIQAQKKSFTDYYLPADTSNTYVVYQYNNQNGKNMVVLFREEEQRKMRFKFFSFGEIQEIDMKSLFFDGQIAKLPNDLFTSLRTLCTSESRNISTATKFERIIYGTIDDTELRKYSPFQGKRISSNENNLVGKTIRNIFVNNRIDSESIKSILTSAIDNSSSSGFRLSKFKEDTRIILLKKEEIERVDKKRPIADEIVSLYDSVNNNLQIINDTAISIKMRYVYVMNELTTLKAEEVEIRKALNLVSDKKDKQDREHKNLETQATKREGIYEERLKDAHKKRKEYLEKDIDSKAKEVAQLDTMREQHSSLYRQIVVLESKAEDLTRELKQEVEASKQRLESVKFKEKEELLLMQKAHADEREVQLDELQKAYNKEEVLINDKEEELKEKQNQLTDKKITKNDELSKIKYASHETEEMITLREKIDTLKTKKEELSLEEAVLSDNMREQDQALESANREEETLITAKINAADIKKAPLVSIVKKVESLIKYEEGTVIDFILKNDIVRKDEVISLLSNEVLLKKDAEPTYFENESSLSIYGVVLQNIEIKDIAYWEKEKKQAESQISEINVHLNGETTRIQDEFSSKRMMIEKDRQKINKRKSEISIEVSRVETSILSNTTTLIGLESQAQDEKKNRIAARQKEIDELVVVEKSIQEDVTILKRERNQNKLLLEQNKEAIKREILQKLEVALHRAKEIYAGLMKDIIREIEEQEENIEKIQHKEGVDVDTIKQLKRKVEDISSHIKRVDSFSGEVTLYMQFKKEYIDKIDDIEYELNEIQNKNEQEKKTREAERKKVAEEIKNIEEKHNQLIAKIKNLHENDIDKYTKLMSSTIETNRFLAYTGRTITAIENLDSLEQVREYQDMHGVSEYIRLTIIQLIARLEAAETQKLFDERQLGYKINNFFSGISDFNFFGLEKVNMEKSGSEENMRVARSVKAFIDKGYTDMVIVELVRFLMLHLSDTSNQIRILEGKLDEIRVYLRKIRTQLGSVTGISVIKSIEIEMPDEDKIKGYQSDSSEILKLLKRLRNEFEERERAFVGQGLFEHFYTQENSKTSPSEDRKLISLLGLINTRLEESKNEELTLEDCFDIRFRVVENNNDSGWQMSLNGIGSEGTDALVKMLINISFLDILKKESIGEGRIHCMIDEIGKLSEGYFKEVIIFGNERGISFINALPAKMLVSTHRNVYKLQKVGDQNVTVPHLLVSREDVVNEDEVLDNA